MRSNITRHKYNISARLSLFTGASSRKPVLKSVYLTDTLYNTHTFTQHKLLLYFNKAVQLFVSD